MSWVSSLLLVSAGCTVSSVGVSALCWVPQSINKLVSAPSCLVQQVVALVKAQRLELGVVLTPLL